jgi:hypothetical protein
MPHKARNSPTLARVGWTVLLALSACGGNDADRHPGAGPVLELPPEGRGEQAADPRLEGLLVAEPSPEALAYLCGTVLFTEGEDAFVSAMCALVRSKSPQVATLAADVLSTGYQIAAPGRADVDRAIEAGLRDPSPSLRRRVVRNLGQIESPTVRQWLKERSGDATADPMHPDARTVSDEAQLSLDRLHHAKVEGRSVSPSDKLGTIVATVGSPMRTPLSGTPFDLVVEMDPVTTTVTSTSGLREPLVSGSFTVVAHAEDLRIAALRLNGAPLYSGGWIKTDDVLMFVWCRPLEEHRVRCWYRVEFLGGSDPKADKQRQR